MQQETLNALRDHLTTINANVEATALISPDGVILFSSLPQYLNGQRVGSIMAAISYCGKQALQGACYGNLKHVLLKLISGYVLLSPISEGGFMAAIFKAETTLENIVADTPQLTMRLAA